MMNRDTNKLIDLFWKGKISRKEKVDLLSKLEAQDPLIRQDLEGEFGKNISTQPLHDSDEYAHYLHQLHEKMSVRESVKPQHKFWGARWAAAAMLLIMGVVGAYLSIVDHPGTVQEVQETHVAILLDSTYINNVGNDTKIITLTDGSRVTLKPGSTIAYGPDYGIAQRIIHQTGEVRYDVARDPRRPFRVYAAEYSTTALGTSFVVKSCTPDYLSVRLLTGKVVVQSRDHSLFPIEDQYLMPGQELLVKSKEKSYDKRMFTEKAHVAKTRRAQLRSPLVNNQSKRPSLSFVDTPLPMVFEQIAHAKGIKVDVDDEDIQERYFTGDFSLEDSLDQILSIICGMNDLEYTFIDKDTIHVTSMSAVGR